MDGFLNFIAGLVKIFASKENNDKISLKKTIFIIVIIVLLFCLFYFYEYQIGDESVEHYDNVTKEQEGNNVQNGSINIDGTNNGNVVVGTQNNIKNQMNIDEVNRYYYNNYEIHIYKRY